MYVLAPVMNKLILALTKRQLACACALALALVSVWPNIFYFSSALNTAGGVSISWFLTIYLCGAYIRLYYQPDGKFLKWFLPAVGTSLLIPLSRFVIEALLSFPFGAISFLDDLMWGYSVFYVYSSILVTATSIFLFLAFLNLRIAPGRGAGLINRIAGASFGVYLIHDHYYIRESLWTKIDGAAWLGHWYLPFACIGVIAAIYLVCTAIELLRQKLFAPFEKSTAIAGFFQKADDKLKKIWNGD